MKATLVHIGIVPLFEHMAGCFMCMSLKQSKQTESTIIRGEL